MLRFQSIKNVSNVNGSMKNEALAIIADFWGACSVDFNFTSLEVIIWVKEVDKRTICAFCTCETAAHSPCPNSLAVPRSLQ